MRTLAHLLLAVRDPALPLITYYDLATGERVELSGTTTANWVAKTSNLLVDELDVERGTRIRVGLPSHWQRMVWILSSWSVGAVVVDHRAAIGVSGPELVADEPVRLAASLRPFAGPFTTPHDGFADLAFEIPGQGDHFESFDPPGPDDLALDLEGTETTHADLLARVQPDDRRLMVVAGDVARDASLLVAAITGGGSLVIAGSAAAADLTPIAEQESAILGVPSPTLDLLPDPQRTE